jgi:hypothetical protein
MTECLLKEPFVRLLPKAQKVLDIHGFDLVLDKSKLLKKLSE